MSFGTTEVAETQDAKDLRSQCEPTSRPSGESQRAKELWVLEQRLNEVMVQLSHCVAEVIAARHDLCLRQPWCSEHKKAATRLRVNLLQIKRAASRGRRLARGL